MSACRTSPADTSAATRHSCGCCSRPAWTTRWGSGPARAPERCPCSRALRRSIARRQERRWRSPHRRIWFQPAFSRTWARNSAWPKALVAACLYSLTRLSTVFRAKARTVGARAISDFATAGSRMPSPSSTGIVELRLDVRQAVEEIDEMLALAASPSARTRAAPGLGMEAVGAHLAPERRVVALGHVVHVDEGAEVVDLAPDAGVVVGAVGVGHLGRIASGTCEPNSIICTIVPWIEVDSSGSRKRRRQPDGEAVADPRRLQPADLEPDVGAHLDLAAEQPLDLALAPPRACGTRRSRHSRSRSGSASGSATSSPPPAPRRGCSC